MGRGAIEKSRLKGMTGGKFFYFLERSYDE